MKERRPFTSHLSPDYLLLGLLAISPSHGYDLHQQIERDLRYVWRLSLSQVYNVLARLEKRGRIQGEIMEQDERPDRKRFQLTAEGKEHLKTWFEKPVGASVHAVRIAFLSKLYFAERIPGIDHETLWDEQVNAIMAGRSRLESRLTEITEAHPILEQSLRLRIMQLETLLEWLKQYQRAWIAR
jgi:DNA-binding PadR family transcriptional regulator